MCFSRKLLIISSIYDIVIITFSIIVIIFLLLRIKGV
jgi:hypothetical protein